LYKVIATNYCNVKEDYNKSKYTSQKLGQVLIEKFNLGFVKILEGKLVKTTSAADGESDHQLGLNYRKS